MPAEDPAPEYSLPVAPPGLGYVPEGYQAPPTGRRPRRLWWWVAAGVALVAVAGGILTAVLRSDDADNRAATGDVAITLRVVGTDGSRPSTAALDRTKQILLARMTEADLTRPTVTVIGTETLLVTAAKKNTEQVKSLLTPGNLTFRRVLANVPDQPGSGTAGCRADPVERRDRAAALASAKAKLGPAFDAAARLQEPAQVDVAALAAFGTLTCDEIEALPGRMQYVVPTVTCAMLNSRAPGAFDRAEAPVVACDEERTTKYQLDVAKVVGADLADAEAKIDPQQGGWIVNLRFTESGQPKWTELTREATTATPTAGQEAQVAVALDNVVVTAPTIQGAITGDATITGGRAFDRQTAMLLAANLTNGVLPVRLVITSVETIR
ncbi:SecDF P1 head subdomain-containing protein [Cryptosporangium aurantiacum]|uniref:SecDF P1 head subdomain domain-containing protein n=1 Tax=Cryptosporangium aurantiacum TaxID=134849 RepID=A0A1M7RM24_9ACTN|nr:hypothetical protein [Cryptosporangium aurantiacum]SHN47367.1 hypothetical protein SAMN05443668_12313 [Cryptosporangium aurantiacum]